MKRLAFLLLALAAFVPVHAQTVASCPSGTTAPWATGAFLPCPVVTLYITQPVPTTALIADQRCPATGACVNSWMLANNVVPTDQVWTQKGTPAVGAWVAAKTLTFASTAPPPPPPPYTTSAVLTWTAPTTNTDGTALTNLAGFNIYSGSSATSLSLLGSVGATVLTYTATIGVGTTYFAVTAFNSAVPSTESAQSTVVSKTVTAPVPTTPNAPSSAAVQ